MDDFKDYIVTDEERAARRAERISARRERQRLQRLQTIKRVSLGLSICLVLAGVIAASLFFFSDRDPNSDSEPSGDSPVTTPGSDELSDWTSDVSGSRPDFTTQPQSPAQSGQSPLDEPSAPSLHVSPDDRTITIGTELSSEYAIVIDLEENRILAQKNPDVIISPASMTKILTILVAAEHITDPAQLDETVTIDLSITDYCYINECSVAGFIRDEKVSVRNLFYGTILPSGADAALGLAQYIAGSHEEFVKLMNEKVAELGLSDTAHFSNCVGLYSKQNMCTVYDVAIILRAAMENELCREILTTKKYEIPPNEFHPTTEDQPGGMVLSNWFLRRIEDYVPDGLDVIGAKTGYVSQAGNCAASIAVTADGNYYICVTAKTSSTKQCIQDHLQLYTTYLGF